MAAQQTAPSLLLSQPPVPRVGFHIKKLGCVLFCSAYTHRGCQPILRARQASRPAAKTRTKAVPYPGCNVFAFGQKGVLGVYFQVIVGLLSLFSFFPQMPETQCLGGNALHEASTMVNYVVVCPEYKNMSFRVC